MNITLYLNKSNSELIAQEPNRGGLINKLLAEHFANKYDLIPKSSGPNLYMTKKSKTALERKYGKEKVQKWSSTK